MKSSNSILLMDPSFDPASAPVCKLLVKIGLDSLSYAIINVENNKVSAVFDEQECPEGTRTLAEKLKTDPYLTLPFKEILVSFYSENTISIPTDLFSEGDLMAHTQFFNASSAKYLYSQPDHYYGFTNIFSLSQIADTFFNTNPKKYQQNAGLLKLSEKFDGSVLLVDFSVGAVNILFVKNQQVIFQQCYETENPEEFNYYLILIINQLNIETKETAVKLTGIIHEADEKYNCLGKYFSSIELLSINNQLDCEILDDMPTHYYTTLLALNECGS